MQIFDAHNDLLCKLNKTKITHYLKHICKKEQVVKIITACFISPKTCMLQDSNMILEKLKAKFRLAKKYESFIPALENIGFVKSEKDLIEIIKLHPFSVTLSWNYDNDLVGGALGFGNITKWGRKVIKTLENNNILIDVAHLNEKSFWEFTKLTTKPIFCSHTASKYVYNIPRNLTDEQIKYISNNNGYIGFVLYNSLLSDKITNYDIIQKHLFHIWDCGAQNVLGLGTDFNGLAEENPNFLLYDYLGMQTFLHKLVIDDLSKKYIEKFSYKNLQTFMYNNQDCLL